MFPADRGPSSRLELFDRLGDPQLYAAAIDRLRSREPGDRGRQLRPLSPGGPILSAVANTRGLAQALARDVGALEYAFGPMHVRQARIRGQARTLYLASPLDEIVLGALAIAWSELLERFLSARVFSYRRGRSSLQAIEGLFEYLRAHRASRGDRRTWGLYVLRRDVKGYGDAIPAGPDSPLWSLLTEAQAHAGSPPTAAQARWLRDAFRPAIEGACGTPSEPARGIPTGSPLQPSACNLYLTPIDRLLESVPGGFYARYGDDMLFAHPEPAVARELGVALDRELDGLGLAWSADKCADLFFNLAGRDADRAGFGFRGTAAVDYLGFRVDFRGVVGLKREKARVLLRDLATRLLQSGRLLRSASPDSRARDLCAIANAALDPHHAGSAAAAPALRYFVSDRAQLRDLDYKIALLVAQALTSRRGVRAFRTHPPRVLRRGLGLVSLTEARNRVGRSTARRALAHA